MWEELGYGKQIEGVCCSVVDEYISNREDGAWRLRGAGLGLFCCFVTDD